MFDILRLRSCRICSDRKRVNKKIKKSKVNCPLHATAISMQQYNTQYSQRGTKVRKSFPRDWLESHTHGPVEISTLCYTHNTEIAHCLDDKYEPEGQPIFPVDCSGEGRSAGRDEMTWLESTAHWSTSYKSSDTKSCIEVTHVHSRQWPHQAKAW